MISNCGHDENGAYIGGAAGDQTGGEYDNIAWYNRPWTCVLRYPDPAVGLKLAETARAAAFNNCVGYDQGQRLTYYTQLKAVGWKPEAIKTTCEADCSSSTAANIIATGYLLGINALKGISPSLTTAGMRAALKAAGFQVLTDSKYLTSDAYLLPGDILLYDGHHVAVNLDTGTKVEIVQPKKSGWQQEDGGWRYYNGDTGLPVRNNWVQDAEGKWYWFDGAGMMVRNVWYLYNGGWYYLGTDGAMVKGLQDISGRWYYLDQDGKMVMQPVTFTPGPDGALKYPGLAE